MKNDGIDIALNHVIARKAWDIRRHLLACLVVVVPSHARHDDARRAIEPGTWLRRLSGTRADLIERIRFRPPRRFGEEGA